MIMTGSDRWSPSAPISARGQSPRAPGRTISNLFVPRALRYAEARGIDVRKIRSGLPDAVNDHVPLLPERIDEIGRELEAALGEPFYGLALGAKVERGIYGIIEFALMSASTVGQGMERFTRYFHIVNDRGHLGFGMEDNEYVFYSDIPGYPTAAGRHYSDYCLAFILASLRVYTGEDLRPRRVEFIHPRPARLDAYEEFFRTREFVFESRRNALIFEPEVRSLPHRSADPALQRVLERQIAESLREVPERDVELQRIEHAISESLRDGPPALEAIARILQTSERTLQRRLQERGTTFQAAVDEVRKDLAMRYLKNDKFTIKEVAFLLGYAQPRAFHRAFVRWNDMTPAQARRRLQREG